MNGKIRLWLLRVAGCLILAAAWSFLATPGTALAKKGGNKQTAIHGCIIFDDLEGDSVSSDDGGPYCDSIDSSIGLLEFFRFHVELARDGTGRTLSLDFNDVILNGLDPIDLPANEDFWTLAIPVHLDDWRSQELDVGVSRDGRLSFGNEPKDVAIILYGAFGLGDPLIVTRIDDDVWTIEGNQAVVARQGKGNANFNVLGFGAMPFKVIYDGTQ
jgi:hypothetical protein